MRAVTVASSPSAHAVEVCRASISAHSKSFALASSLLPVEVRDDVAVLYAFCRRVDDAIDLAPEGAAASALEGLRCELASMYAGETQRDVTLAAMQAVAARRRIPYEYPEALLDGMAMDVAGVRYGTVEDLLLYGHRVAGVVGLMMCHVLGVRRVEALPRAAHLGLAMQLTNVCRDVAEDWRRGRLYLPAELLGDAAPLLGRPGRELPPAAHAAIREAVRTLLDTAEGFYRSADIGVRDLSPRCGVAVRAARRIYSAIGDRLAARGHDPLLGRVVVTAPSKLTLVVGAILSALPSFASAAWLPFQAASIDRLIRFPDDVLPLD